MYTCDKAIYISEIYSNQAKDIKFRCPEINSYFLTTTSDVPQLWTYRVWKQAKLTPNATTANYLENEADSAVQCTSPPSINQA